MKLFSGPAKRSTKKPIPPTFNTSPKLKACVAGIAIPVAKAPAKSDETLEEERLARKAVKDEKERQKEIEREKNREASEKAAKEEEKKRVEEAKAKLAAKAAKRKK